MVLAQAIARLRSAVTDFEPESWLEKGRSFHRTVRDWAQKQWVDGVWLVVPVVGSLVVTGLIAIAPGSFSGLDPMDVSTLPPGVTYPWRDSALASYDVRRPHSIHAASARVAFALGIAERRTTRVREILYAPVERPPILDMDAVLDMDVPLDARTGEASPRPAAIPTIAPRDSQITPVPSSDAGRRAPGTPTPAATTPNLNAPPAQAPATVSINSATSAELQRLPRIGPALAERIIAGRPYRRARDLLAVPGIGRATLAGFEPSIRFE
ncbi:MAG: competence protein ComEA [Bradymonadia bacterium]